MLGPVTPIRTRGLSRCDGCGLTRELCLCAELPRIAVRTRVVVLMHHVERRKPTNTGRLVVRCLEGSELRLRGLGRDDERPPLPEGRRLLLYPDPDARELSPEDALGGAVLVVPDGNWNQARRMARRDPDARGAELVRLGSVPESRYRLRRNPRESTVSTLEAIAWALGVLDGAEAREALLDVLDRFVERALAIRASGKGGDPARRSESSE